MERSFKVYIDRKHIDLSEKRDYYFNIIKVHFFNTLPEEEKLKKFGAYYQLYTFTENLEECDFAMLPMAWNYYIETGREKLAEEFITRCKKAGKKITSWVAYDYGVTPSVKDIYIYRMSGYQRKRLPFQYSAPFALSDQLFLRYQTQDVITRNYQPKLVLGFCGQANGNLLYNSYHTLKILFDNLRYYLGIYDWEPQVVYPPVYRRHKILNYLEQSTRINTQFIRREKYRGGADTPELREKTTIEYYENILNSDYVVCVRGGGNFSVRFFETLMMGRIPLYIHTDSILPLDNYINWKKHVVWIDEADISKAADVLADFHAALHPDDFIQMQIDNRALWKKYLTPEGFLKYMADTVLQDSHVKTED